MSDLEGYQVTFRRNPLIGMWNWTATAPDGTPLSNIAPLGFVSKEAAEADALRRIEIHKQRETIDGNALRERVEARQ